MVDLPPYTVADLAGTLHVARLRSHSGVTLTARIENVFNKSYEEVLYYAAPSRTVLVGARIGVGSAQFTER
jgi:outer membrane cobalamin receptor